MNYRVGSKREPVKKILLRPAGLLSKYPPFRLPPGLQEWFRRALRTAVARSLAIAASVRGKIHKGGRAVTDAMRHLELRSRFQRSTAALKRRFPEASRNLWRKLVDLGRVGARFSRRAKDAVALWICSRRVGFRRSSKITPSSSSEAVATDLLASRVSPEGERHLREELIQARARLVEELVAEEAELTRVATRVVRLQTLIRSHEQLIAENADPDDPLTGSGSTTAPTGDDLITVGDPSSEGELRSTPLLWRN